MSEILCDIVIFDVKHFSDERGSFTEAFVESKMAQQGLPPVKQINVSYNQANVVRGFHLQVRKPQGKYIRVLKGRATACLLDLRHGTFGDTVQVELTPHGKAIYVPPGFGNSFWTHEETIYHYGCTDEYDLGGELGVNPMDPAIGTPWRSRVRSGGSVIVSQKDLSLPNLADFRSHL